MAHLPVNPALSALRNQARQKLATLDKNMFSELVVDVLNECYGRQQDSMRSSGQWLGQGWDEWWVWQGGMSGGRGRVE